MCCTSIFTCKMTLVSNFLIIYTLRELFEDSFSTNITYFCILMWSQFLFVIGNIFFFLKSIIFFAFSRKDSQYYFMQSFPQYKVCLFSMWSNAQVVDIEYLPGICSPIFLVEELSGLFAHSSVFLIKDSMSA